MGTSTPFGGGRNTNPLIPSWIPAGPPPPPGAAGGGPAEDGVDGQPPDGAGAEADTHERYRGPRRSFNAFAKSGGASRRALGQAAKSFVGRTGGGAATTSHRMAAERQATARFADVLARAQAAPEGIRGILRELDLDALADASIEDIYAALVDHVCPPDGDLDDAHAREAYLEAVNEAMRDQPADAERPSPETIRAMIGGFVANAVNIRIINAIANKIIALPRDVDEIKAIRNGMRDFIDGCVRDAMAGFEGRFAGAEMQAAVDDVYERAADLIHDAGDAAEGERGEP